MMKMSKTLAKFFEEAKETDSYWVEDAKLQFAISLEAQRRASKMSYAAIAKKIGSSAAYITKIFRGDTNMTIETMVKLARSTGGRLELNVVDAVSQTADWSKQVRLNSLPKPTMTVTVITDCSTTAANYENYKAGLQAIA